MIPVANIKKSSGLEGLLQSYTPHDIEEVRCLRAQGNMFQELLDRYVSIRQTELPPSWHPQYRKAFYQQFPDVLTPAMIFLLTPLLQQYESLPGRGPAAGHLLGSLIQNSYHHGYNDFILPMENSSFSHLGAWLYSWPGKRRLHVTVQGSTGEYLGMNALGVRFTIENDVADYLAYEAKHSIFVLKGFHRGRLGLSSTFGLDIFHNSDARPYACQFWITQETLLAQFLTECNASNNEINNGKNSEANSGANDIFYFSIYHPNGRQHLTKKGSL